MFNNLMKNKTMLAESTVNCFKFIVNEFKEGCVIFDEKMRFLKKVTDCLRKKFVICLLDKFEFDVPTTALYIFVDFFFCDYLRLLFIYHSTMSKILV